MTHKGLTYNFSPLTVPPGKLTTIKITPTKATAADSLRAMTEEERGCRFPHETQGMEILRDYSFKGCVFECMLRLAREECGCTPWNYPHPPGIQHTNVRAHFILYYTLYTV